MKWWANNKRLIIFLAVEVLTIVGLFTLIGKLLFLALVLGIGYYLVTNYKTLKNTKAEDWFNPMKYASVAYAFFMKLLFPMHIVEQLILRMYDMQCRQCAREGTCFNCKCDASKMYVPWEWCSLDNWGPMVEDADEYREMRKEFPAVITVRYPKEENPNAGFYEFIGHQPEKEYGPFALNEENRSITFTVPDDAKPHDRYVYMDNRLVKLDDYPTTKNEALAFAQESILHKHGYKAFIDQYKDMEGNLDWLSAIQAIKPAGLDWEDWIREIKDIRFEIHPGKRSMAGLVPYEVRVNGFEDGMALWSPVYLDESAYADEVLSDLMARGVLRLSNGF